MKKNVLISLLVAAMGMIVFMGCEKPETDDRPTAIAHQVTDNPQGSTTPVTHNTTLSYTGCHSSQSKGYYDPIVSTEYENGVLLLRIENYYVNCGIDSLSVVSEIDSQTINVSINEICELQTNCTCPIDVNYSIDKIAPGNYELIIIRHELVRYQGEIICE